MEYTYFDRLKAVNVDGHKEEKNGLSYLSWVWAVSEVTKLYPDFDYEVETFDGLPYVFDPKTGYMVFTKVTIEGKTKRMWLPVMDGANKAMLDHAYTYKARYYDRKTKAYVDGERTVAPATMFDINKTIMRCLTKNLSMFGLGLYIYAGEDFPDPIEEKPDPLQSAKDKLNRSKQNLLAAAQSMNVECTDLLKKAGWKEGEPATQEQVDKAIVMLKEISDARAKDEQVQMDAGR